jgi:uncharacterized protein
MPPSFVLLGIALVAAWSATSDARRVSPWWWQALLLASCGAALYEGLMDWRGVLFVAALLVASHLYQVSSDKRMRIAWGITAVLVAAALATHRMPGFAPLLVAEGLRLSPTSAPMTVVANFDKGLAGIVLLACFCKRAETVSDWMRAVGVGLLAGAGTAAVVIALAVAAGAVRFDPKLPEITAAWLAINLGLTCVFEEALFRGVLQRGLALLLRHRPRLSWVPLAVASLLFGLAHAGGGPVLVAVATLAGVGYGVAYAKTDRIEAAVIAHFTLNSIHFLGFTYPYAAR